MGLVRSTAKLAFKGLRHAFAAGAATCKKHPKAAKRIGAALGLMGLGYISTNYVRSDQFALRQSFFSAGEKTLPSGFYVTLPWPLQYTHSYESRTQRIEFSAGSGRFLPFFDSTGDRNILTADIAINYKVVPDPAKLKFHLYEMDGWMMQDGYWLLTKMANDSANAVLGRCAMAETLANPQRFIDDLKADLEARLEQNNVPVEIESLELKHFDTLLPAKIVDYKVSPR